MTAHLPWLAAPDWADGITETLEWKTDILQSQSGAEQRIARRLSPRRLFEFSYVAASQERATFENALARAGAMRWLMPIWQDIAWLNAPLPVGASFIPLATNGRDYQAGTSVLLQSTQSWLAEYEVATVAAVSDAGLTLTAPLARAWATGTAIYPLYAAELTDPPTIARRSSSVIRAQVRFRLVGGHDSPEQAPGTMYRGHPVLEHDAEWIDDLSAEYSRMLLELDNSTGIPFRTDTAQQAFIVLQHTWVAAGRGTQGQLRALFYYLRGCQRPLWMQGPASDLEPVSDANGNHLDVQFTGLSTYGLTSGRRDIAITLTDGSRVYRRIINVSRLSNDVERLSLDGSALHIPLSQITNLSFMGLFRLNADAVQWEHLTDADGVATVSAQFRSLRDELE
ncbi:hypothetical protein [Leminorella grimontii]|uniref:hypothetical protein n=1 Tax=Leminorella grimontii TaxID=82981 RepID=UPI003220745F